MGFPLTAVQAGEIERGKDFVQLRQAPSTWIWCSLQTASSGSRTPGHGASTSRGFPSVIPTRELHRHCGLSTSTAKLV